MIDITTIASSSKGNCYKVSDGKTTIMLECGITYAKLKKAFDFNFHSMDGCLVTHEHSDHTKALNQILDKTFLKCYMTKGTSDKVVKERLLMCRVKTVKSKKVFKIGTFQVMPFDTHHDAAEPVGYLLQSGSNKILFATDTAELNYKFPGLTHIMIECNYSKEILNDNMDAGIINNFLGERIKKSHFSIENLKKFFEANDLSKCEEIHLLHLSGNNSDPKRFKKEIQELTGIPTYVFGK